MLRKPLLSLLLGASVLSAACSDSDEEKPDPSVLIIDRETVSFGELEVGQTSPEHLFTVRNASAYAVESVSVRVEGSGFTIAANTCERFLDAGMECEVRVRFSPRMAGPNDARLKVEGAAEVDEADLRGMGVAWVEVRNIPSGDARVVAEGEDWSCDEPCRVAVRKPQLTLRAAPAGFPTWGGDCTVVAGGGCSLTMDGTKAVSLQTLTPLFQWEVRRSSHPRSVAVAANGDIVVQEVSTLLRLSSTGQVRWSVPLSGTIEMGMDGQGNTYVVGYSGQVTRYDAEGRVVWTYSPAIENPSWHELAVSPNGQVYVLLGMDRTSTSHRLRLVAFTPEGTERWSRVLNEGDFNYASNLAVDAQGGVSLSGSVSNRGPVPEQNVFVKGFYRRYSEGGELRWERAEGWSTFAVNASGATSAMSPNFTSSGGFTLEWIDPNGTRQWATPVTNLPGTTTQLTFSRSDTLLLGGHEVLPGSEPGRGWFAAMNLETRKAGPVTYVDRNTATGGPVIIRGLALAPSGHVVVVGGFSDATDRSEGYIRLYDPRALTGGL